MAAAPPPPFYGNRSAGGEKEKRRRLHCRHYLVPLVSSHASDAAGVGGLMLGLPGSFGRVELLRPFLSGSCRACSISSGGNSRCGGSNDRQHSHTVCRSDWQVNDGVEISTTPLDNRSKFVETICDQAEVVGNCNKEEGGKPPPSPPRQRRIWCEKCRSIKSMAKFIPRTNFLNFAYPENSSEDANYLNEGGKRKRKGSTANDGVRLTISGLNASQLVHITSTTLSGSKRSLSPSSSLVVEINDGDIISLVWYRNGQHNHDRSATPGGGGEEDGKATMNDNPSSSTVLEPLIQFRLVGIKDNATDDETDAHHPLLGEAKESEEVPTRTTKEDGVARSTMSYTGHNDANNTTAVQHRERLEEEVDRGQLSNEETEDVRKASCNNDHDGVVNIHEVDDNDMDEEEEEDESALLTLPSRFLASYSNSFSFDSVAKSSPSQSSANATVAVEIDANCISLTSGTMIMKNEVVCARERTSGDMTSIDPNGGTIETPKKTNVTALRERMSVPITSLSYDQLVQLHEEMTHPIFSMNPLQSPSIRHTVLSLTLALTSNVSSYQSNLLRKNNMDVNERANTNGGARVTAAKQQILPQHWMPRLLSGTRIRLQKNNDLT